MSEANGEKKLLKWAVIFLIGLVLSLSGAWAVRIEQRVSAIENAYIDQARLLATIAATQSAMTASLDRIERHLDEHLKLKTP